MALKYWSQQGQAHGAEAITYICGASKQNKTEQNFVHHGKFQIYKKLMNWYNPVSSVSTHLQQTSRLLYSP